MVRRPAARRGFALLDAILGGTLLAVGLAGVVTLSQRSLVMLQRGEQEAMAAAMLDELLAGVVTEGPTAFTQVREPAGRMRAPWPDWEYAVEVRSGAVGDPMDVTAMVRSPEGIEYRCMTRVAPHDENLPPDERAPEKPLDRATRYDEKESEGAK